MSRGFAMQGFGESELFAGVGEEALLELGEPARTVTVPKGNPLYLPSDPERFIYFLKSGRIKILRISRDGREFILDIVERGEIFGEMGILDKEHEETVAKALEDSCVGAIPWARFGRLVRSKPELAMRMAQLMGLRRKKVEDRLESLAFQKVPGRVANLLLHLSREYGVPDPRGTLVRIRLSQQDIGNLIGATRESVNHTLSDFRRKGLIDLEGRRLIVRQPQPLEQLV